MKSAYIYILAAVTLLAAPFCMGDEEVIFDQGGFIKAVGASQFDWEFPMDWMTADDFTIEEQFNGYYLTKVVWWGAYDGGGAGAPEGFYLVIFQDNTGEPLGGPLQNIHYYIEANPGYAPPEYQNDYLWAVYIPIGECIEEEVPPPRSSEESKKLYYKTTAVITVEDKFQVSSGAINWFCPQRKMLFDPYIQWYPTRYAEPHENGYRIVCGMYPDGSNPYWFYNVDCDLSFQFYGAPDTSVKPSSLGRVKAVFE